MKRTGKIKVLAGLLALTLVAGTFAYFSKTMSIDNQLSTKGYGGETIEKFTPTDDWQPGAEIDKDVQAKNTGDYPLYVRVKFNEKWERTVSGTTIQGTALDSVSDYAIFFPTTTKNAVTDGSSVYKNLSGVGTGADQWTNGKDGWFYYNSELAEGATTEKLLDSITLCKDADMGEYTTETRYAVVTKGTTPADSDYTASTTVPSVGTNQELYQKVIVTLDSNNPGLAGAKYTLTVTTEIVQATPDAATGWTTYPGKTSTTP